jgi:hypothetical protein
MPIKSGKGANMMRRTNLATILSLDENKGIINTSKPPIALDLLKPRIAVNPQGEYTQVRVVSHLGVIKLFSGTGILNAAGIFLCGNFDSGDHPEVEKLYNIWGNHNGRFYQFPKWECIQSGATSDFKTT